MILITGGTGFLGRFIVDECLRNGEQVRILARNPAKVASRVVENPLWRGVDIAEGDLLDHAQLDQAMKGVDRVIHAAAVVSFWPRRYEEMREVNVTGTELLIDVCLENNVSKILHVSSIAALGRTIVGGVITEKAKWSKSKLNTQYGRSKYLAELQIYRGVEEGLKATICNPGLILGAGNPQSGGWTSGTPRLFNTVYKGLRYYNPGATGIVAAEDVARGIYGLLQSDFNLGERFIMVAENIAYKQLFERIASGLKVKPPRTVPPAWLVGMAARFLTIKGNLRNKEPLITPETARISRHQSLYDGSKITQSIDFQYSDMEKVIEETAQKFLHYHASSSKR
jgi:nucleoside-diphosphate-sugar epimerase